MCCRWIQLNHPNIRPFKRNNNPAARHNIWINFHFIYSGSFWFDATEYTKTISAMTTKHVAHQLDLPHLSYVFWWIWKLQQGKEKNDDKLSWLVRFHKHVYLKKDGFFGFWHRSYSWLISFRNSACTTEKARKCHCFVVEITRERITASWSTKGWCGMLFRSSSSYKLQTYPILSLVCRRENKSIRFRFHATHSIWL